MLLSEVSSDTWHILRIYRKAKSTVLKQLKKHGIVPESVTDGNVAGVESGYQPTLISIHPAHIETVKGILNSIGIGYSFEKQEQEHLFQTEQGGPKKVEKKKRNKKNKPEEHPSLFDPLPDIFMKKREEYLGRGLASTYQEINSGLCSEISWEIADEYPEYSDEIVTNTLFMDSEGENQEPDMWNEEALREVNSPPPLPVEKLNRISYSHVWIHHNGKHYDAEAYDGVDSLWDLPYFKRKVAEIS